MFSLGSETIWVLTPNTLAPVKRVVLSLGTWDKMSLQGDACQKLWMEELRFWVCFNVSKKIAIFKSNYSPLKFKNGEEKKNIQFYVWSLQQFFSKS